MPQIAALKLFCGTCGTIETMRCYTLARMVIGCGTCGTCGTKKNGAGSRKLGVGMSDTDIMATLNGWLGGADRPASLVPILSNAKVSPPTSAIDTRLSRDDSRTNITRALKAKGIPAQSADALASRLVERDRQLDDRRSCVECLSFQDGNCLQRITPIGEITIYTLHRCTGFQEGLRHGDHSDDVDNCG